MNQREREKQSDALKPDQLSRRQGQYFYNVSELSLGTSHKRALIKTSSEHSH